MPPNVLIVVIDSLRADAVFGDRIATPNMDSYAANGAAFKQCVSTCTTTTPSFSSILTACYPPKHGIRGLRGYRLSSQVTTMAEGFKAAGYETYARVTGPLMPQTDIYRGFDDYQHRLARKVSFFGWMQDYLDRIASATQPWFMLLHTWEVHRPYQLPSGFAKRNDRVGYEAAVAATDEWLPSVIEAAGDDTIVVITGDHGEEYPESTIEFLLTGAARRARRRLKLSEWAGGLDRRLAGMDIGHGFALHEHLIRVPLIITGPGVHRTDVPDQVRHVDLFPTLAELCGVEAPQKLDGRSLGPLMRGESLAEEPAYLEAVGTSLRGRSLVAARTARFKLLLQTDRNPILYDISGSPPNEKTNVYHRHQEVAGALESFVDEVDAAGTVTESGMTAEQEEVVEEHLRDLGYL